VAVTPRTALALLFLLAPAAALAGPTPTAPPNIHDSRPPAGATRIVAHRTAHLVAAAHRAPIGMSIGSPTTGKLVGGAQISESPYLRIVPFYKGSDARWGLESLVGLIDRSAQRVRKQFPDAVLSVGHLSKKGGGEIDRHASHESGRDADIGFYIENQSGKPIYSDHFVAFLGDGTAPSWPGARFDDARNWALVASLVGDGRAHITHIFVAQPMRARLLQYAERIGAPQNIRVRAAELMAQPKGSLPHDDHFHVRIGCPSGMDQCIEQPMPKHHPQHGALAQHHAPPPPDTRHAAPSQAKREREKEKDDEASAKSDATPNLAPMVPGLDSVVIPKPLAAPPAKSDPIDDADGVLDSH
jgi:penicillin-insensitive murein endopeptidase